MVIRGCQQNIQELEMGSNMRLFETNYNEAVDPPASRNVVKTLHCKRYNPVTEFTSVGAQCRVCTYDLPKAIGLRGGAKVDMPQF